MIKRNKHQARSVESLRQAARAVVETMEARVLLASGVAGAYYNNIDLAGTPVATRVDPAINFNWTGSPGVTGIGADFFSVRWSGTLTPKFSQTYTFTTRSDDGVRLFVNGTRIINNWTKHAPTDNTGTIALTANQPVSITMEFYEAAGGATAQLFWQSASQAKEIIPSSALSTNVTVPPPPTPPPPAGAGNGLLGTYFDNMDFTSQKFTRTDSTVNFNWGSGAPASSIQPDLFSVRWTGSVLAPKTETYTFYTHSDDGAKLTVNGQVLVNKLVPQGPTTWSGSIALIAGQKYSIQYEYIERYGGAQASLSWSSPTLAKQIIPTANLFDTAPTTPPTVPPPPPPPPTTPGTYQPDGSIQVRNTGNLTGDNVYNTTGVGQAKTATGTFYSSIFHIRIQNDGKAADSFNVLGQSGDEDWLVAYYDSTNTKWDGGVNITKQVLAGTWNTGSLEPGAFRDIRVDITAFKAPGGSSRTIKTALISAHDTTRRDLVSATVDNPVKRAVAWRRQNWGPDTTYLMTIQNQGNLPDQFTINSALGVGAGSSWNVDFFDDQWGGNNVTAAVKSGGGWKTRVLQPWESQEFRVVFNYSDSSLPAVQLTAASVGDPNSKEIIGVDIDAPDQHPINTDFFPIGVWSQPRGSFAKWKSRGINTLIEYEASGALDVNQWSTDARNLGLYYIRRPIEGYVRDIGDPYLLAWAFPDEPEINDRYTPETLAQWRDNWHGYDPNRAIWVNHSGGWVLRWQGNKSAGDFKKYTDLVDWVSSSIYPVTGWNRPIDAPGLDAPGQSVDRLEKISGGKPQWAVIEPSDQELPWAPRDLRSPTAAEFRFEVWDSIIKGAKGIIYFPQSFQPGFKFDNMTAELANEMIAVNAKVQSIGTILLTAIDPPTRGLEMDDNALTGTWRIKDGKTYYVVLNKTNQTISRSLTFQGIGAAASATVVGESRSLSLSNGTTSDTFAPYSVHVYQVG